MKKKEYQNKHKEIGKEKEAFLSKSYQKQLAREAYFKNHIIPDTELISREIVESWDRSLKNGLKPYKSNFVYLEEDDFKKAVETNAELIHSSDVVLKNPYFHFGPTIQSFDLYNRNLCLIKQYRIGPEYIEELDYLKEGIVQSEDVFGNTAMSCAIAKGTGVQLVSGEIFSDVLMDTACTAAPIFFEGKLVGVLSIVDTNCIPCTGIEGTIIGLTKLIENTHEQQLLRKKIDEEAFFTAELIDKSSEGIIVFDSKGNVLKINASACKSLETDKDSFEGKNIFKLFKKDKSLLELISNDIQSNTDQVFNINIKGKEKRFTGSCIRINRDNTYNSMISFKDIGSLNNVIQDIGGWNAKYTFEDIIGNNKSFREEVILAKNTAGLHGNVLIEGESGTGKELFAHAIHNQSSHSNGPFVTINCGSIPATLIESELFGYEGGAFTGAKKNGQIGKFELANYGTVFLDEVNSLPLDMQVKLLRVLQDRTICRVGGNKMIPLHIRVIASSNEKIWELVQIGKFRPDLYYRMNVIRIHIPPLRERKDDIMLLVSNIIEKITGFKDKYHVTANAIKLMESYPWPGNIRELENVIERSLVNADMRGTNVIDESNVDSVLELERLSLLNDFDLSKRALDTMMNSGTYKHSFYKNNYEDNARSLFAKDNTFRNNDEKDKIVDALTMNNGNVSATAKQLKMSRNTLYNRINKYDIKIKNF